MILKDRKGFTLVEGLAIIAILSLVLVIGGTLVFNMINNAEKESFEVTRNNVLNVAKNYVIENKNELFWHNYYSDNSKFVCVSINQLVNKGLLNNDVKDNKDLTDYVMVWKDTNESIISEELDTGNNCSNPKNSVEIPTSKLCDDPIYNGISQNLISRYDTRIEFDNIKGIDAGTYTIKANLKDKENNHWKDGTIGEKSFNCSIKKDVSIVTVDKNVINTGVVVGNIINVKVSSNVSGILLVKSSNDDYYEVLSEEIKVDKDTITNISIKILSSKETEGYITITIIPDDNKNYYSGSSVVTIGKASIGKVSIPVCKDIYYNGDKQILVDYKDGILFDKEKQEDIGEYKVTAKLRYGYAWDRENDIFGDIELTCSILRPTFTILYNGNGGKLSDGKVNMYDSVLYEANYNIKSNQFYKNGYTFTGWNTKADGTGYKIDGILDWTMLTDEELRNHEISLYAQWKPNKIYVQYHMNGGSWDGDTSDGLSYSGDYVTLNGSKNVSVYSYDQTGFDLVNWDNSDYIKITKKGQHGKDGAEWNTKADGSGTSFSDTNKISANSLCDATKGDCTVTLYVNWVPNTYTIKYSCNGGTGTMSNTSATYGKSATLRSEECTRTGYSFIGWATSSDGKVVYANKETVSNLTTENGRTVTLYAKWQDKKAPTCSYSVSNNYNTAGVTIKFTCSDNGSGCSGETYNKATSNKTYNCIDKAGNIGTPASITVKVNSRPLYTKSTCNTCQNAATCSCSNIISGTQWGTTWYYGSSATEAVCRNYCSTNSTTGGATKHNYKNYGKDCARFGCVNGGWTYTSGHTACSPEKTSTKLVQCTIYATQYYVS